MNGISKVLFIIFLLIGLSTSTFLGNSYSLSTNQLENFHINNSFNKSSIIPNTRIGSLLRVNDNIFVSYNYDVLIFYDNHFNKVKELPQNRPTETSFNSIINLRVLNENYILYTTNLNLVRKLNVNTFIIEAEGIVKGQMLMSKLEIISESKFCTKTIGEGLSFYDTNTLKRIDLISNTNIKSMVGLNNNRLAYVSYEPSLLKELVILDQNKVKRTKTLEYTIDRFCYLSDNLLAVGYQENGSIDIIDVETLEVIRRLPQSLEFVALSRHHISKIAKGVLVSLEYKGAVFWNYENGKILYQTEEDNILEAIRLNKEDIVYLSFLAKTHMTNLVILK